MPKLKRLFWDIETSPNVVLSWRVGAKLSIGHDNILKERAVICICWKWEGEKTVHSLTWDQDQDDRDMILAFLRVAAEADELIAHNGDRFDMKWFRTRCLYHGVKSVPPLVTVDTLQWARRLFNFNSNRLDYIAQYLGVGGKLSTGFKLWKRIVLQKDAKALSQMVTYCKNDVAILEKVWAKLRTYAPTKTNAAVVVGKPSWACPHCGSTDVVKTKTRVTAGGALRHQMQCKAESVFYTLTDTAYRGYIKVRHG